MEHAWLAACVSAAMGAFAAVAYRVFHPAWPGVVPIAVGLALHVGAAWLMRTRRSVVAAGAVFLSLVGAAGVVHWRAFWATMSLAAARSARGSREPAT